MLAVGASTLAAMVDAGGLEKMTPNLPLAPNLPFCEKESVEKTNQGAKFCNPGQNGGSISVHSEKHEASNVSLQQVLSDSISGILMEDAMVMPCGHSFGVSGLHRVKETSLCLTCGAPVPANSMIPNYALRAAVLAYKHEGTRRKKELRGQAENDVIKVHRAFADAEVSQPRGVQFPYVANDRVLIKGNKRTPERFVGREAIITTQCLNGWYLVKTLDTGESVRLQYRSFLKLEDRETTAEVRCEKLTSEPRNGDSLKRPLMSVCHVPLTADNQEGFPPKSVDRIEAKSFLSGVTKDPPLESLSRANQNSQGSRRGNQLRVTNTSGTSWRSARTSSNSSQGLQGDQVRGKRAQEAVTMSDSGDEDQRAIKRIAAIDPMGGVLEASTLQSNCSALEHNATRGKVGGVDHDCAEMEAFREAEAGFAGDVLPGYSCLGSKSRGKRPRARPKHVSSEVHKGSSSRSDLQEADPYKKVFVTGLRRRTNNVNSRELMAKKQSAFASLNLDFGHCSTLPLEEHKEADVKTSGESSSYQSAVSFCESLKKKMLDLEADIPWSYMQNNWKTDQAVWLDMLRKSSSLKDVAKRLEELRRALILERAGNMSDDEWNKELEAAVEQEAVGSMDYLWRRLHDDVSKLLISKIKRDRKPLSSIKVEFLDLKSHFPQLCIGGLSRVGVIAATSMAAAEAYATGEEDIETLLTIPMKLVQDHNTQDLRSVIDAIEREKRHLSAKVLKLCSPGGSEYGKSSAEDLLIRNTNEVPTSSTLLAVESEASLKSEHVKESTLRTNDGGGWCIVGNNKEPEVVDTDTQEEEVMPMVETGGEETDLSDSD